MPNEKQTTPKSEQKRNIMDVANTILADKLYQDVLEIVRYQYNIYKGFLEVGCSEKEAVQLTTSHLEAMFRANKPENDDSEKAR